MPLWFHGNRAPMRKQRYKQSSNENSKCSSGVVVLSGLVAMPLFWYVFKLCCCLWYRMNKKRWQFLSEFCPSSLRCFCCTPIRYYYNLVPFKKQKKKKKAIKQAIICIIGSQYSALHWLELKCGELIYRRKTRLIMMSLLPVISD